MKKLIATALLSAPLLALAGPVNLLGNGSISQTVATVVGQWYTLSFEYSNRTGTDPSTNGLAWSFGNSSGDAPALAKNVSADNVWQLYSTTVQATASQTTLTIWATGTSDSYGSSLDAVSLSAVPEPQTWALLAAGFVALGVTTALRRRQAQPARAK